MAPLKSPGGGERPPVENKGARKLFAGLASEAQEIADRLPPIASGEFLANLMEIINPETPVEYAPLGKPPEDIEKTIIEARKALEILRRKISEEEMAELEKQLENLIKEPDSDAKRRTIADIAFLADPDYEATTNQAKEFLLQVERVLTSANKEDCGEFIRALKLIFENRQKKGRPGLLEID